MGVAFELGDGQRLEVFGEACGESLKYLEQTIGRNLHFKDTASGHERKWGICDWRLEEIGSSLCCGQKLHNTSPLLWTE